MRRLTEAGARVSVDLNFRKKLWTEAQAQAVMGPMMREVDVVIANEEDLQSVLGVHVPDTDVTSGQLNLDGFRQAAERVTRDFGPPMVAITLRESVSASDNGWSAALWDAKAGTMQRSQRYSVRLVDRIGGGDSFAAGLIYGLVTGRANERRAPVRRRGERVEADHSRRFQPDDSAGSRSLGRRGCVGTSAAITTRRPVRSSVTPTTMKRIAQELGVSITTVSKVLNEQPDIGPATRARVLAKVEELGYRPNAVARSLTLRRTHTLGVVIPDLMHSFFVEIVSGIESVDERPRLWVAALQLWREPGQGALRAGDVACPSSGRHRLGVGSRVGQHRRVEADRGARLRARDDRS